MITTITNNDYQNISRGSSSISESSDVISIGEELKPLKYNDDFVQLEQAEEIEVQNCTNADQAKNVSANDEDEDEERDLTNLTWLTELRNQTMGLVNMPLDEEIKKSNDVAPTDTAYVSNQQQFFHLQFASENDIVCKSSEVMLEQQCQEAVFQIPQHRTDKARVTKILNQPKRPLPAERYELFLTKIKRDLEIYEESATNYQSEIIEKPPFNYSHIIGMAMLENGKRVTLQQICSWIERKFAFFRVRKKWNNSIRHNLSLHPCFRKIGRNKEDKGKGGYWELGIDPKKCDRKRIRNRKSTGQSNKTQKKHLPAQFIKATNRRQQNLINNKKLNVKNGNSCLRHFSYEQQYEELMLDEMDVQQNIDVMSTSKSYHNTTTSINICCEQPIAQQSIKQFNSPNDDHIHLQQTDNFKEFNKSCSLSNDDIGTEIEHTAEQTCRKEQQYRLNTVIISSGNLGANMPNIQNINQRTINSFLIPNLPKQPSVENQLHTHCMPYSETEDVEQNDNINISSYISNFSDEVSNCRRSSKSNQCSSFATSSNSITLDFTTFPTQTIQQKLIQQSPPSYPEIEICSDRMRTSNSSPSFNSSNTAICTIGLQNVDYPNGIVNEHVRPYIDGIDEAFQYLRSIDNAISEDILDNLLDISVNDY